MTHDITVIEKGSVVSPIGFLAGATYAGLKTYGEDRLDLGILTTEYSQSQVHDTRAQVTAAGMFTTNLVRSPSVTLSQSNIANGAARAIIANSGCANCCVGQQGLSDAREMADLAGGKIGIDAKEVLVCSTGIIGVELPMALIRSGIPNVKLSRDGGHEFARSILTTDTKTKELAVSFTIGGVQVRIGGCAKGAGMVHPNMATMLCFLTTDAAVSPDVLETALNHAVDRSFNMISIDHDTSTNDSVLILANGAAGGSDIQAGTEESRLFEQALESVCISLAKMVVIDGEGATKLIEATVKGAKSIEDARAAARAVTSSNLVKSAVYGNDPNWGRMLMAAGQSGAYLEESKISLYINDVCIVDNGLPIPYFKEAVVANMDRPEVRLLIDLNLGDISATAWGCDLSEEYVTINSAYTT